MHENIVLLKKTTLAAIKSSDELPWGLNVFIFLDAGLLEERV